MSPKMTKEERDRRVIGLATDGAIPFKGEAFEEARRRMSEPLPQALKTRALQVREQLKSVKAHVSAPSENAVRYANRAIHAHNSELESELFDHHVQELMGVSGLPVSNAVLDRASLLRGGNPCLLYTSPSPRD